jgi:aryl-alcohol dehydrogenase-like predicted oxidoreductase
MYGDGMAERTLGKFLRGEIRKKITLASKFGIPADPVGERFPLLMYAKRALGGAVRHLRLPGSASRRRRLSVDSAESSLAQSLGALRTDWLDILFLHEPEIRDCEWLPELADWLVRQKAIGRVRYLGLAGQAGNCLLVKDFLPGVFDVLQVEDSLSGREADALTATGHPLQVTYGYIRKAVEAPLGQLRSPTSADELLQAGLARNTRGMVLVSTRKLQRVGALAATAAKATS